MPYDLKANEGNFCSIVTESLAFGIISAQNLLYTYSPNVNYWTKLCKIHFHVKGYTVQSNCPHRMHIFERI